METKLRLQLEEAVDSVLADYDGHQELLHPSLTGQMVSAAAEVYDACKEGQEYYKEQTRGTRR